MAGYWLLLIGLPALAVLLHAHGVVRFDTALPWTAWAMLSLIFFNGLFMAYDGARALITGDYITPQSGEYAGQLGPWSQAAVRLGIEPRSTLMKLVFVGLGLGYLVSGFLFAIGVRDAFWAIGVLAILGLWYLPVGTVINVLVLVLLWIQR